MQSRQTQAAQPHLVKGMLAGMAGGLVGSWVMNLFIAAVTAAQQAGKSQQQQQQEKQAQGEDTTQKVADLATRKVTGEPLSQEGKQIGGPIVHYAFGTIMGGVYGLSAEALPVATTGGGTLFGSALFIGADELSLPALQLAKWPTEEPISAQAEHWAAHLVYGATAELVRRTLRSRL